MQTHEHLFRALRSNFLRNAKYAPIEEENLIMILSEHPMFIPLLLSGIIYAVLCVFSIVTGIIYMSGKKELNPLELSDEFVRKLDSQERKMQFARKMGLVTFIVGIVQGLTSYAVLKGQTPFFYWIAMGFTVFSICSVCYKLKGKINAFPLLKLCAYLAILVILLLPGTRALFNLL